MKNEEKRIDLAPEEIERLKGALLIIRKAAELASSDEQRLRDFPRFVMNTTRDALGLEQSP